MHIKQVTIQGFKSYKDQTAVEPFTKKHNVVVGKNGSGKSNFFKAIQFVLGDESEFGRLGADSRQNLLHEGAGNRVHTAYVEIAFDNSDGRIPVDSEEVVLRRTISSKQDQYTLNGKSATKQDVANLLETAGFSKSNPYYIVKQGKVNELSTAPADKRLNLLYEVAGTKVYDERRRESQEAMKEATEKTEQTAKAIANIEERLKTLEEEKEDLKKYQHYDKKRRMLEHTVFTKDLDEVRNKVLTLEQKREEKDATLKGLRKEMREHGDEIQKSEKLLRDAKAKVSQLNEEKRQLAQELDEHQRRLTQLELSIKDTDTEDQQGKSNRDQMKNEQKRLEDQIQMTELDLANLKPKYEEAKRAEDEASQRIQRLKQRRNELFDKRSRGDRFRNKEERDRFLTGEIRRLNATIAEKQSTMNALENKLEADTKKISELEKSVKELEESVGKNSDIYKSNQVTFYNEKQQRDEKVTIRKDLWRQENALRQSLGTKKDELDQRENSLKSLMGKSVLRGLEAVKSVIEDWRQNPSRDNDARVKGYHGMLVENIKCDELVFTAVDTVAGNRLFHHIVANDEIASAILEEINRRNLPGESTFLPLNRLTNRVHEVPDLGEVEAMRLIDRIKYSPEVAPAVQMVFGKTLVCRYLEVAVDISKRYKWDCVTPDGDTVNKRGPMSGGFVNRRESRMMMQKNISEIKADIDKEEEQLDALVQELEIVDGELEKLTSEITLKETKLERAKSMADKAKYTANIRKEELRTLQAGLQDKETKIAALKADIATLEVSRASFEKEKGTELTSVLTAEEQEEVQKIDVDIRDLNKKLKGLFDARGKLEIQKNSLQSTLQDNLMRRLDELKSNIQENETENLSQKLLSMRREMNAVRDATARLQQQKDELEEELVKCIKDRKDREEKVEEIRNKEKGVQEKIIVESRELDKIISRLILMQKEKDDCVHKIRELASLPAGLDNSEYMRKSLKELGRELDEVNKELQKFGHVNQRALDQYVTFSDQRTKLMSRQEEMDRGQKAIVDLMANLEQQKFDAIMFTFQQVTRNFEMVFKELVPNGRGHLTLLQGSQESSIEESQADLEILGKFTGIGVKVTFTGGAGEMKDMHQLSGGQKTLVALATIFAIQRCDPAPFYLFDEVDQALDPDHRKSVGRMIESLSQNAQFITTTFRAELLDHADKFYGVKYDPQLKISRINVIKKIEAQQFIDDDESQPPTTNVFKSSADPSSREMTQLQQSMNKTATTLDPGAENVQNVTANNTTMSELPSAVAVDDEHMDTGVEDDQENETQEGDDVEMR
ncbi:hypothetical protein RvY_15108 [Ramazzottius varieornatus]|uniref:Structural maintenance of chromosomes protein n=1 Tax=Ramazzottius varieornatus TaxID=947166 RepID=A0A1D1VTR2_RAMVA|nr:hypothetical protein RvY_15108 [Ramazzottius varieornatus]